MRALLALAAVGILVAPGAATAQTKVARVGFLVPAAHPPEWMQAFRDGLREQGWLEGQNLRIEWRSAEGRKGRYPGLLAELVGLKPDVLVTWTTPAAVAAKQATATIPVITYTGDPVGTGLVASLARPGGNVTGVAILTEELEPKGFELLREALPSATRLAVLQNPTNPVWTRSLKDLEVTARTLRVKLQPVEARDPGQLDAAFAAAARERAQGILVVRDDLFTQQRERVVGLAARHRLPALYGGGHYVDIGGLMAYGVDNIHLWRRVAGYVDKVLRGARPAELPVEQPTKFELLINLKTAKALGLTIPQALLIRADRVIR